MWLVILQQQLTSKQNQRVARNVQWTQLFHFPRCTRNDTHALADIDCWSVTAMHGWFLLWYTAANDKRGYSWTSTKTWIRFVGVFLCSETLFVIILFVQCFSVYVYIVVLSMFVGTIFVDTHSVEDTSTYICGHSSANQKCCPVSYFDEHLILWVRSINNEIYPNFVTEWW